MLRTKEVVREGVDVTHLGAMVYDKGKRKTA